MSKQFDLAVFEPEVILPEQMSGDALGYADTSGPRALMRAILTDALLCIERGRHRRHWQTRRLAADAEKWMRSDSREWLFSFANICDVLGIDPGALRHRLFADAGFARQSDKSLDTARWCSTSMGERLSDCGGAAQSGSASALR